MGQVRGRLQGAQRPLVVGDARDREAIDPSRLFEVLDAAEAGIDQARADRDRVTADRLHEHVREDDLPAVRRRGDTGRVVDVDADVVRWRARGEVAANPPRSKVQPCSDPQVVPVDQGVGGDGALRGDYRVERRPRRGEGGEHRIALGLDDVPALALDRRSEAAVMFRDDPRPGRCGYGDVEEDEVPG